MEQIEVIDDTNTQTNLKAASSKYNEENFYTAPSNPIRKTFTGTTSGQLNNFIKTNSNPNGRPVIIKVNKKSTPYLWSNIVMKTNVHLEIAAGTIIQPSFSTNGKVFDFGSYGRIKNVSLRGLGSGFTVDISGSGHASKHVVVARICRVNNFKLENFKIKDKRSYVNSITIAYQVNTSEIRPYAVDGVLKKISQTGAHTGYGLIQAYAGDHILFYGLSCEGGVTFRLETDDRGMKKEIKNGDKIGGIRNFFAYNIECSKGITPLMFSPHFVQNGKVTVDKVVANGCAVAVRVIKGGLELFDNDMDFPIPPTSAGTAARNKSRADFTKFIEKQFEGRIPAGAKATKGNAYARNNGTQWAIPLSEAGGTSSRNSYVKGQLGTLKPGKFATSFVNDITANFKNNFGAKLKSNRLQYIPCNYWKRIKCPTNPGTNLPTGFEYHGPSMALSVDGTNGTTTGGNYRIRLRNESFNNFPSSFYQNIKYNSEPKCSNNQSTITRYTANW